MVKKAIVSLSGAILITVALLGSLGLARSATGSNIDPTDKFAWSANTGWINLNPQCTGCEGVIVYADHLEGYAWSESIGWMRMGSHTGGGAHTYANTSSDDYGVNIDATGVLSGYAWSATIGWINFNPNHGGVTVDLSTGEFDGYAWSESVGWIHFKHTSAPTYGPVAVANVTLVKSVTPSAAWPGDPITYTLRFSNTSFITAMQVVLTDTIPISVTNTTVISSGVMITQRAGTRYVWDIADLASGAGGTITITGVLSDPLTAGTFTNTAIITTAVDADASNNTAFASIMIPSPPVLQSISPKRNSHTVPQISTVAATYDVAMDASTVTSRTFVVHGRQSGLVTATHGLANDGRTLVVTPTQSFYPNELVHAIATTRTHSLAGLEPLTATQWHFRAVAGNGSGYFASHLSQPNFGAGTSTNVALGDLDGDDDLDIFVAQYNLTSTVWLNAGQGSFTVHPTSPNIGYATDIVLGDIDGDGDLDAVAVCYNQAQTVWLNDGAGAFTAHPTAPTFGSGSGPSRGGTLGDIDNDGDLDAVVANQNGAAETVWVNDGTGVFTAHPTTSSFGAGDSQTMALGDIDGDGDLDALVANTNGQNETVWVNDGAGNFTPHPSVATFDGGPDSMYVALSDLDADGDLDAWIANFSTAPHANTVWLNDGTGAFSDSGQALGDSDSRHVALGDIDGDGDLDALVANTYGEANTVWKNDGAGNFAVSSDTANFGTSDSAGLAMGDIDGDSDLDVIVANDNGQAQTVWVQRNTLTLAGPTTLALGEAHAFTATISPASAPSPITYTWDTGERIITHTSGVSDTAILSWTTAGTQFLAVTMTSVGDTANLTQVLTIYAPITAVDLSLLTGGAIYTDTQVNFNADLAPDNADKPYTYTVDYGDGTLTTQATISDDPLPLTHTFATTGSHQVEISVWNDGMARPVTDSLSVTVAARTIYLIPALQGISPPRNAITAALNTNISATYDQLISPTTVTSHTFAIHGMQSGLVMATHGLDADGHTLIVTPTHPFHQGELIYAVATTRTQSITGTHPLLPTQWQFNAGQVTNRCVAGFTEVYAGSLPGVSEGASTWGDYDNDGDLDILLVGYGISARMAKVYENTGSGFAEDVVASSSLTGVSVGDAAWGDYDNDGDLDILITGWDGSNAVAKVYQNTGGGFNEVYAGDLTSVYHSDVAWGDYDNDGDLDILLTGNKVTHVYQNTGDGFVNVISNLTGISHGSVAWGDYDNDGDLDILLTGQSGSSTYVSKVYQNTGAGFSEVYAGSLAVVSDGSVAWGDYDNDGDLDILLSGDPGSGPIAKVYENTGGGFVEDTAASSSLSGVRDSHVAWGDYDNDGDLDLILSGRVNSIVDEGVTKVYENTGNGFSEVVTGSLTGVFESSAVWGDYDNDGDLDILLTGYTSATKIAQVYRNDDCAFSPPTGVTLAGPNSGLISQTYTFTATVNPITTTMPVTYAWRMEDGEIRTIEHVGGLSDTVAISWTTAGAHAITVTASNVAGGVSDRALITIESPSPDCPRPLSDVRIDGPTSGYTDTAYAFTAVITPTDATPFITYTWSSDGLVNGQGTENASYNWSAVGAKIITLTAENCGGAFTAEHTITIATRPSGTGDNYEPDNTCDQARTILTDGTLQEHTFHVAGDSDWTSFAATSGTEYLIEAVTPSDSTADVSLEIYDSCGAIPTRTQDHSFSPDVRLRFTAPADGMLYLRTSNSYSDQAGPDVAYQLSVRSLSETPTPGGVIIVAGRLRLDDELQRNIHNVTNEVYNLFLTHGYSKDRIYYLATKSMDADGNGYDDDVDVKSSHDHLKQALTQWATDESLGLGPERALTLYLMDHGGVDRFYLDGSSQTVGPDELDGWLDTVEAAAPGVRVNVIMEACHSGSFVDALSQEGRVVIASTAIHAVAYATQNGARFSDTFLESLKRGLSLYNSFEEARWTAETAHPDQTPWLDDDGDGMWNEAADGQEAARRGFAYAGTFDPTEENWPPYIVWARVDEENGDHVIKARVEDNHGDAGVNFVWAVTYKPSYTPPSGDAEEMPQEALPTAQLQDPDGDGIWEAIEQFDELGEYRLVIYAADDEDLSARPKELSVRTGWSVYLPLVLRR